jgi:hypothetical protein
VIDKIEPVPRLFIWDYWDAVKYSFSLSGWTTISILLYFILLILIGLFFWTRDYVLKKWVFIGGIVVLVLQIISFAAFTQRIYERENKQRAIIVASVVNVKSSPDDKGTDLFVLHEGVKVEIVDKLGGEPSHALPSASSSGETAGWVNIKLADGKVGWVKSNAVVVI